MANPAICEAVVAEPEFVAKEFTAEVKSFKILNKETCEFLILSLAFSARIVTPEFAFNADNGIAFIVDRL